jgi:hypothetical protein
VVEREKYRQVARSGLTLPKVRSIDSSGTIALAQGPAKQRKLG